MSEFDKRLDELESMIALEAEMMPDDDRAKGFEKLNSKIGMAQYFEILLTISSAIGRRNKKDPDKVFRKMISLGTPGELYFEYVEPMIAKIESKVIGKEESNEKSNG